jgi:hypothetical protein
MRNSFKTVRRFLHARLHCEALEARAVPATLYVDSSLVAGASVASLGGRVTLDRDSSGTLTAGDQVTVGLGQTGQAADLTFGEAAVSGDVGSAYGTIQAAIAAASAGDTIKIAGGTYPESVNLGTQLTLQGLTGTATDVIIHPPSGNAITVAASDTTIRDLRVTGGTNGIAITASGISGLTVNDVQADANTNDGIDLSNVGGALALTDVKATGNGAAGLQLSGAAGSTLTLTSLTDTGNTGAGLTVSGFGSVNLTDLTLTGNGASSTVGTAAGGTISFVAAASGTTAYAITASGTQLQVTKDPTGADVANQAIALSGETSLSVSGGAGADTFAITPSASGGTTITVVGGSPAPASGQGTAGDTLNLNLAGVTTPNVSSTFSSGSGFAGTLTASGIATVSFSGIEALANGETISGTVFTDTNGNGAQDPGEAGVSGMTVHLSVNSSGAEDLTATTDASGHYSFTGLAPGSYQVRADLTSGLTLTTANPAAITAILGQTASNVNFGVQAVSGTVGGTVNGTVFGDTNGNGVINAGENALSGVTVFLDLNGNGQLNAGEPATVSSATGTFTLTSTTNGLFTIRALAPAGFSTGVIPTVNLMGGDTLSANVGLRPNSTAAGGTLTGEVFADTNRDGILDNGETGVSGVTVFLDANDNGRLDPGEVSTTTNASGDFTLTSTTNGLFTVRAVASGSFVGSTSPTITLSGGGAVDANVGLLTSASSGGSISGIVFDDKNRNGTLNPGENPVGGVTVFIDANGNGKLDGGEPFTVTDRNGAYTLSTATNGQVTVDAVLPVGYLHLSTTPTADLTGGATVGGENVGLFSKLPPQATPAQLLAIGIIEGGGGHVKLFDSTGKLIQDLDVSSFAGSAEPRVVVADVTGDGVDDIIIGTGVGVPNRIEVLDGATLKVIFSTQPFESSFTGGVYVTAGDVTGDGVADIIVTPDEGGGPRVVVYQGGTTGFPMVQSFYGIEDVNFRGGARATVADINGDGIADLIVAAGFGGGPRVAFFDGSSLFGGGAIRHLFNDIFVFEQTLRNGVFVTAGDIDGDGFADLIIGGGPGGGPRVEVLSGASLTGGNLSSPNVLANFFAGDPNNRGGAHVAVKDLSNDGSSDLVVGDGDSTQVTGYTGKSLLHGNPNKVYDFEAESGASGGVFVG